MRLSSQLAQRLEAAMALLDSGVDGPPRQAELAELLRPSASSLELVRKLEKITDPIPSLALEISRAYGEQGWNHAAKILLQKTNLPIPCDVKSRRLIVNFQCEIARCESYINGDKACGLFTRAIRSSIDLLGPTHIATAQVRVHYMHFLERTSRYSGALDVLSALKADSEDLLRLQKERFMQMEARLRWKKAKRRHRERPMPVELSLVEDDKEHRERPTPVEPSLAEDDKENVHQSELHSPSRKRKFCEEPGTSRQEEREEKIQKT
ncbi:hypothetical protein F5B17DRAFT_393204 [Nemania serpens]|nr:hypothetical protein F5B17DRAFT_393204 [Nemania serpens]